MNSTQREALRIKTLHVAVRPGASAIAQLAAAIKRRSRSGAGLISVAGFRYPDPPDFPGFCYPGRKALAPVYLPPTR
ncbi:MAG: hypothetical protein OEW05_01085 [Candidatus Aminicenantes bacterium]|nr:hypothetical protein [Candidatus Aminicenantes bacterium]